MPTTFLIAEAGSYTIEDDGTPGNGTSVITRDSDGAVLAVIAHPADLLSIQASVPGVNITLNITDSLGTGSLQVGDLANPGQSPDSIVVDNVSTFNTVTLVANGSITEAGSDSAVDIQAASVVLSAGTGVGAPGNALETQTGAIEAETDTGGIAIGNVGAVQIGGLTDAVAGLHVVTSGDIDFTNLGTITLADITGAESIHGGATSGDVNLTAIGFDSDITSAVDRDAILATGGNITLTAGRDISWGTAGANFDNDVRANGGITFDAGRDVLISGFADMIADLVGAGGGNFIVNAGRNIGILDDTGGDGSLSTSGAGSVILTTGANGLLSLEAPFGTAIFSGGDVVVNADRVAIAATSGITANGDIILRPVTDGRAIILGSLSDVAAALELSDVELSRIFTSGTFTIGGDNAGSILVSAVVSTTGAPNVTLRTGETVNFVADFTTTGLLTVRAGDDVFQLVGSTITAGDVDIFVDLAGDDGNRGGVVNVLGTITATTINGVGNALANVINGNSGNNILDGAAGADSLNGGLGNDTYVLGDENDTVTDTGGTDTITSTITRSIAALATIENLTLLGAGNINGTGNALANIITGNSGVNVLNGNAGLDTLIGGLGNDAYMLGAENDTVIDTGGNDLITSTISRSLAAHASIERLTLLGAANINGTGNALNNIITGNSGVNVLDGGAGLDTLDGGLGNDVYELGAENDTVIDSGGNDLITSTISRTLADFAAIERLTLIGADNINGSGNGLNNLMTGNGGNNIINGGAGSDTINGGAGADRLFGNIGNDTLTGGTGADFFVFHSAPNAVTNVDTITDFSVADDTISLENSVFTTIGAVGTLAAAAFVSNTTGLAQDASDRIIYESDTGNLFFDSNGSAADGSVLIAVLDPGLLLTNLDFTVI